MCTCVSYLAKNHYFGRNLDLEYSYNESIVVTPRHFPLRFNIPKILSSHHAMIGIATVADGYPLYYDAVNEFGVCAAALHFPGNAVYCKPKANKLNIAPFELITWILAQSKNISEAITLIDSINITDVTFSAEFPNTPLHWMISDRTGSFVIEPMYNGVSIQKNPVGVLTNNPPFDFHMNNICLYQNLSKDPPQNRMSDSVELKQYCNGMGAIGLPGDLSSPSRFVRAAFTKFNSIDDGTENHTIHQMFHILKSVEQQYGCVKTNRGYEKTVYTSCCNTDKGIYYYTTYNNSQIKGVKMHNTQPESDKLFVFPLEWEGMIDYIN